MQTSAIPHTVAAAYELDQTWSETLMADAHRERDPSRREADIPAGAAPGVLDGATGMAAQEGPRPLQAELWELPSSPSVRLEVVPPFPTPAYTVVTEPAALARLLPQLQAASRLGVDTETTGLDPICTKRRHNSVNL